MVIAQCNVCGTQYVLELVEPLSNHQLAVRIPELFRHLLFGDGQVVFCNQECRAKYPYDLKVYTWGQLRQGIRK